MRRSLPALLGAVLLLLVTTQAWAGTTNVQAGADNMFVFSPKTVKVPLGGKVVWKNVATATQHTTTQDAPLGRWDSGALAPGDTFPFTFKIAGGYPYHCSFHVQFGMKGVVRVPDQASPSSGTTADTYTITMATVTAPKGFVYDTQMRTGTGSWSNFQTGLTSTTTTFQTSTPGTYSFRSRLRKVKNHAASGYSPPATVTVSSG